MARAILHTYQTSGCAAMRAWDLTHQMEKTGKREEARRSFYVNIIDQIAFVDPGKLRSHYLHKIDIMMYIQLVHYEHTGKYLF